MVRTQNEMVFFNVPLISSKNSMFHFIGEKLWLTVASLESMQFPKNTGFDKGKFECHDFPQQPVSSLK